jgi:WD40 repeat protein
MLESGSKSFDVIKASDQPVHTISFNSQRPGYLASGDKAGYIKIWRLSQNYTKGDSGELKKLNDISEKPFEK